MTAKKWIRRLVITLVVLGATGGLLHWLLLRSLKEVIAFTVEQQTNGAYAFRADAVDVSWSAKQALLRNAVLQCRDTAGRQTFANVRIASLQLTVDSWREILLDRKVGIGRFELTGATVEWHDRRPKEAAKQAPFHPSMILDGLKKALVHLRVRSFDASGVSFVLFRGWSAEPFAVRDIRFSIRNFEKINNADGHIFGSDSVSFSLGPQHWVLPESHSRIAFSGLRFLGNRQHFEVDSLSYAGEGASFAAAKAFFNTRHLPALYQKEELILDTVRCVSPVLSLPLHVKKEHGKPAAPPFKKIQINVIEVTDARLHLKGDNATALRTDKTDLGIYGLKVVPGSTHPVTTDSIRLDLDDVAFLSKDSLSQLVVARMIFRKKDAFLVGVKYGPVNPAKGGMRFTAPLLHLKQIHLDELLKKRLVAHEAELVSPGVSITPVPGKKKAAGPAGFYETLHHLGELISVRVFQVRDGQLQMHAGEEKPVDIHLRDFDTRILLRDFLDADSLVDIKHALPTLTIGQIAVHTPKLTLDLGGYRLDGVRRRNWLKAAVAHLANGTTARASGVYWEAFDWDVLQKQKAIQINRLEMEDLDVAIRSTGAPRTEKPPLPVLRITELAVARSHFSVEGPKMQASWKGQHFFLNHIRTQGSYFQWDTAKVQLTDIVVKKPEMNASIRRVEFDNQRGTRIQGIEINAKNSRSNVPEAVVTARIRSTDFREIPVSALEATGGTTVVTAGERKTKAGQQQPRRPMPQLNGVALHLRNWNVRYLGKKDSIHAGADIQVRGLSVGEPIRYDSVQVKLSGIQVARERLSVQVPVFETTLTKGEVTRDGAVRTAALLEWKGASAAWAKNDSVRLQVKDAGGTFHDANLVHRPKEPFRWQDLVPKARLWSGPVTFDTPKSLIGAEGYAWSGSTFSLLGFHITPRQSREETFRTAQWQADYQVIKGKALHISGIRYGKGEEGINVRKIIAEEPDLTTSRDKNIPFRHGIEKLMPTRLIGQIGQKLAVDTVEVVRGRVTVHESVPGTTNWGLIPLENMYALIRGVTNRPQPGDSLRMLASLRLFDNHIRRFYYREAYADSLSGFRVQSHLSRMSLPGFNPIVQKMASVEIRHGISDTLYASWAGNKYAAFGVMHFYYNDLAARLLDKKDPNRKPLLLRVENFLANAIILHKRNRRPVYVFFERDREKFVFNYLVKAKLQGVLSAIGVKSSRKFLRKYREVQRRYGFPDQSGEFVVEGR